MKNQVTSLGFALCVALSCVVPVLSQTAESTDAANTATTAYVYVQVAKGINVYNATAAGKLTLVKGSPFAVSGQMEGHNGKYLVSVGTTNLHTYSIGSTGAVGKQVGNINTQLYSGAECGTTSFNGAPNGAVLDHTGKYFFVQLYGASQGQPEYNDPICAAWQTYQIAPNGGLSFLGDTQYSSEDSSCGINGWYGESTVPTISSSDQFAYGVFNTMECTVDAGSFSSLEQDRFHVLQPNPTFAATGPSDDPANPSYFYYPAIEKADPAGHLAALLVNAYYDGNGCGGWPGCNVQVGQQLASYTINPTTGAITSTNAFANMPIVGLSANLLSMSPSGKLLALGQGPGLQIFHFNGAAPITPYSALLLPTVNISQMGWDNSNHLYALSYLSQKLYVYTVTPTSITPMAGSPYTVPTAYGANGLIVVPK